MRLTPWWGWALITTPKKGERLMKNPNVIKMINKLSGMIHAVVEDVDTGLKTPMCNLIDFSKLREYTGPNEVTCQNCLRKLAEVRLKAKGVSVPVDEDCVEDNDTNIVINVSDEDIGYNCELSISINENGDIEFILAGGIKKGVKPKTSVSDVCNLLNSRIRRSLKID
jgi:hypothetical protein